MRQQLQRVVDPFEILGIARTFDLDLGAVEKRHRELSRALHPDKYLGAAPSLRRDALAKAVEVNEAWRVVRDPIRRAEALLRLSGVSIGEGAEVGADPEFLMEMLERREALSDARQARDVEAVRRLAGEVAERARCAERALSDGLARTDGQRSAGALTALLGELRFYRRFLEEVSAIEDELAA